MGFTWTISISQYSVVLASAINEIRDHTDELNNSRSSYCATHYNGYDSTVLHSNDSSYNVTHYPNYYSANQSTHCPGHYPSYYSSNCSTYNVSSR